MRELFGFRLEPTDRPSRLMSVLIPVGSILLALIACGILLAVSGENPFEVYRAMFNGAFGDKTASRKRSSRDSAPAGRTRRLRRLPDAALEHRRRGSDLSRAPFLRPGWRSSFSRTHPASLIIPAMIVAGMLGGAIWALIPGALRAYLGANETITTLMLNYIAIQFIDYLVHGPLA